MKLTVKQLSNFCCVSIRTLHYYDEIGMLKPSEISDAGYRFYDEHAIAELQKILFLKELDFSLDEIRKMMANDVLQINEVLSKQKELLKVKQERLEKIIKLIEGITQGEIDMNNSYNELVEKYSKEAKEQYGSTKEYKEFEQKTKNLNKSEEKVIHDYLNELIKKFAEI